MPNDDRRMMRHAPQDILLGHRGRRLLRAIDQHLISPQRCCVGGPGQEIDRRCPAIMIPAPLPIAKGDIPLLARLNHRPLLKGQSNLKLLPKGRPSIRGSMKGRPSGFRTDRLPNLRPHLQKSLPRSLPRSLLRSPARNPLRNLLQTSKRASQMSFFNISQKRSQRILASNR